MSDDPDQAHTRYLRDEADRARATFEADPCWENENIRDLAVTELDRELESRGIDTTQITDYGDDAQVGLGVQALQVYKSLSDAAKEMNDQPEPQRQGAQHDDSRAREDADTIRKLKAELEKSEKKREQERGIGR